MNSNPQTAPAEFRAGEIIAERYRIISSLGAGPNSTVYKAEDLASHQFMALKLVSSSASRRSVSVSKYHVDLNLISKIDNPGLVRIFEFGEHLGRIYVAMELVEGVPLRSHLQSTGRLAPEALQGFLGEMCDVLGAIHTHRVIHGGIHPGNIMQAPSGAWKLLDFGIGRGTATDRSVYTAPEQLQAQPSSAASDLYALGAVSYEMVTGRLYKRAASALVNDRETNGIPAGVASVLEGCLRADPKSRFQTALALKSAAAQALGSLPGAERRLSDSKTEAGVPAAELMPTFVAVIRALLDTHASGAKHADLEPENIRMKGSSVQLAPRSKSPDGPSSESTLLISNAKYTAPELIMAQKAPDPAAHVLGDIYVVGFVFYELLAGKAGMRQQFGDIEEMRTGLPWMRWHADPASRLRPLADIAPACPKGLADLVERMAEKVPAQRVRTLEEVAESLEKLDFILARTQPEVVKSSTPQKRRPRNKGPILTFASAFALLALILGGGRLLSWGWHGSPQAASQNKGVPPPIVQTPTGAMVLVQPRQFYIDRLEVSNREYRDYCARTGYHSPDAPSWDANYFAKDNHPVLNVNREDAAAFCASAGKRLPTEQEWERAAGAEEVPGIRWGNWTLPGLANLAADRPTPIGSFAADVSPFGMLDAAGNVQEWVAGGPGEEIVKGGSFATRAPDLSPVWRRVMPANAGTRDLSAVGFRCAVDAPAGLDLDVTRHVATSGGPLNWLRRLTGR